MRVFGARGWGLLFLAWMASAALSPSPPGWRNWGGLWKEEKGILRQEKVEKKIAALAREGGGPADFPAAVEIRIEGGEIRRAVAPDGDPRPAYVCHAVILPGDDLSYDASYPAFHHSLFIDGFLRYYRWSRDEDFLRRAVRLADWNLTHSTPPDWLYGSLPWSTWKAGRPGGGADRDSLQPDKAAVLGRSNLRGHRGGEVPVRRREDRRDPAEEAAFRGKLVFPGDPPDGEARRGLHGRRDLSHTPLPGVGPGPGDQVFRGGEEEGPGLAHGTSPSHGGLVRRTRSGGGFSPAALGEALGNFLEKSRVREFGRERHWTLVLADLYEAMGRKIYRKAARSALNTVTWNLADGRTPNVDVFNRGTWRSCWYSLAFSQFGPLLEFLQEHPHF